MAMPNSDMIAIIRTLPIPVPWDRNTFIDSIAQMRGRPITLRPTDTATLKHSPCGVWVKGATEDTILYESGTSEYHIDQIICHEIGHMVLEHDAPSAAATVDAPHHYPELWRTILPDLDPANVRAVLGRMDYTNDREHDAETFATMVRIAAADAGAQASMMGNVFFQRR